MEKMRKCKRCGNEFELGMTICPVCYKKQGGTPVWLVILLVILCIGVIGSLFGGNEENKEKVEYVAVDIDTLEKDLEDNAAAAKDKYNGKYLEITGRLGVIDSDLKYISLLSPTDEWDIIGVHCSIKNSKTKDVVKTLTKDQTIVVKGKITDVGEVLGYYLDIEEIIIP